MVISLHKTVTGVGVLNWYNLGLNTADWKYFPWSNILDQYWGKGTDCWV